MFCRIVPKTGAVDPLSWMRILNEMRMIGLGTWLLRCAKCHRLTSAPVMKRMQESVARKFLDFMTRT